MAAEKVVSVKKMPEKHPITSVSYVYFIFVPGRGYVSFNDRVFVRQVNDRRARSFENIKELCLYAIRQGFSISEDAPSEVLRDWNSEGMIRVRTGNI